MPDAISHSAVLIPEALLFLGIVLLRFAAGRGESRIEGAETVAAVRNGAVALLAIAALAVPIFELLTMSADTGRILRLLPLESTGSLKSGGLLVHDALSTFFKAGAALAGLIAVASRGQYGVETRSADGHDARDVQVVLGIVFAAFLLSGTNDLLVVWGGVEILALSLGSLSPAKTSERMPALYHGFFSAMILFGIALLYGMFGTTELFGMYATLSARNVETVPANGLLLALLLVIGGMAAHIGTRIAGTMRDVWNGPLLSGLSLLTVVLLSTFVLIVRLTIGVFPHDLQGIALDSLILIIGSAIGIGCALLAVGTGNVFKGICLATVAHLGLAILPLGNRTPAGYVSGTLYLILHLLYSLLAAAAIRRSVGPDWNGDPGRLQTEPKSVLWRNAVPALLLLSLAGVPFTAGFLARFFLLGALVNAGHPSAPSIIAGSTISILLLYAHGRWLHALYFRRVMGRPSQTGEAPGTAEESRPSVGAKLAGTLLGLGAVGAVVAGFPWGFRILWDAVRTALGSP